MSVWLLVESTRLLYSLGHNPRITACYPGDTPTGDSRDLTCEIMRTKWRPTYQKLLVITAHWFLVNPSTANKERGDRKDGMCSPRYTPTQDYNKFHYTTGLTVPNRITRPRIHPMTDHNLSLLVASHPSIHGYKYAPRKREHNRNVATTYQDKRWRPYFAHFYLPSKYLGICV